MDRLHDMPSSQKTMNKSMQGKKQYDTHCKKNALAENDQYFSIKFTKIFFNLKHNNLNSTCNSKYR